jgi:transcriptional regulator with XRE-family HTH domain
MKQERQEQHQLPAPAAIRRPASGISIDPGRLMWWRESLGWSRQELSDEITALDLKDKDGAPLTVTRDAISKIENGERQPKSRTLRALCAGLRCTPRDLMPDSTQLTPHMSAEARRNRLAHNRELRLFARQHGIRYKNPVSGRVYYSVPLREAFNLAAGGADDEAAAAAVTAALASSGDDQDGSQDDTVYGVTGQDGIDELGLSVRTFNCLDRAGIRTIEDLAGRTAADLDGIRAFGAASMAETRERLAAAGFTLSGEIAPGETPAGGNPELLAS